MLNDTYQSHPRCAHPDCNQPVIKLVTGKWGKHCSAKCRGKHNSLKSRNKAAATFEEHLEQNPNLETEIRNKKIVSSIKKYGTEWPMQNKTVTNTRSNNLMEKHGVINVFQLSDIKEKSNNTRLEKYGVKNMAHLPESIEKKKITMVERYGVDNASKSTEIWDKKRENCLLRYGVNSPNQDPTIHEKQQTSLRRFKDYILPSGKIIRVQGYEHFALDRLLLTYHEGDIITERRLTPKITYAWENKERRYFPDIFLPKENKIIEVKSQYTYNTDLEKNLKKQEASIVAGYSFEFWIIDAKDHS